MKREVYFVTDHMITALGFSSQENMANLYDQRSGLATHHTFKGFDSSFTGALIDKDRFNEYWNQEVQSTIELPFLERLAIYSIKKVLQKAGITAEHARLGVILATTKGNINFLVEAAYAGQQRIDKRVELTNIGQTIQNYFGFTNAPIVVSNACISGTLGIIMGKRFIESGYYDEVLVCGLDLVTLFTLHGFSALKAMSPAPCRPFDKDREGINLGEACGTIFLSTKKRTGSVRLLGGAISNDANHISGPSRTGSGLYQAISRAVEDASETGAHASIDFINAHGTATLYNDEMEAKAFALAGVEQKPLNSLKGYWGHTLGAAGVIECIASCHSLKQNKLVASKGFAKKGVSKAIQVIKGTTDTVLNGCLKTSSGFGGCNAAIILSTDA